MSNLKTETQQDKETHTKNSFYRPVFFGLIALAALVLGQFSLISPLYCLLGVITGLFGLTDILKTEQSVFFDLADFMKQDKPLSLGLSMLTLGLFLNPMSILTLGGAGVLYLRYKQPSLVETTTSVTSFATRTLIGAVAPNLLAPESNPLALVKSGAKLSIPKNPAMDLVKGTKNLILHPKQTSRAIIKNPKQSAWQVLPMAAGFATTYYGYALADGAGYLAANSLGLLLPGFMSPMIDYGTQALLLGAGYNLSHNLVSGETNFIASIQQKALDIARNHMGFILASMSKNKNKLPAANSKIAGKTAPLLLQDESKVVKESADDAERVRALEEGNKSITTQFKEKSSPKHRSERGSCGSFGPSWLQNPVGAFMSFLPGGRRNRF